MAMPDFGLIGSLFQATKYPLSPIIFGLILDPALEKTAPRPSDITVGVLDFPRTPRFRDIGLH